MGGQKVKIISASRYNFTPDGENRKISGCRITFLGEPEQSEKFKGHPVVTLTGPEEVFQQITKLPGDYEIYTTIAMRPGKTPGSSQPVIKLEGLAVPAQ